MAKSCYACLVNEPDPRWHGPVCDRFMAKPMESPTDPQFSPVEPVRIASVADMLYEMGLTEEIHEPALTFTPKEEREKATSYTQIPYEWTKDELLSLRHLKADYQEGKRM